MYFAIRRLLFQLDPETVHHLTLGLMRIGGIQPLNGLLRKIFAAPSKPVEAFGLTFKNPVGLAAGYDKDGLAVRGLSALGFGHIEIGTVTPRPQPGNPKPRVFRLVEDEAVINRMGFGKNKDTPLEEAASDYIALMQSFTPLADYLAINVSSPNTVGLRRLQGREMLEQLLGAVAHERERIILGRGGHRPILVKLAPDLSDEELEDAVGVILDCGMDGIIATNTTLAREGLRSARREESGGLSGSPLRVRSEAMLEKIVQGVHGKVPIVSVGGIMSPEDAKRRLGIGATLVQVYTGLIYRGPRLVREIVNAL